MMSVYNLATFSRIMSADIKLITEYSGGILLFARTLRDDVGAGTSVTL